MSKSKKSFERIQDMVSNMPQLIASVIDPGEKIEGYRVANDKYRDTNAKVL